MNLPELIQWEAGIYQLEQTDLVLGGLTANGGISNLQAELLGNRTAYLYDQLGRFNNIVTVTLPVSLNTINSGQLYRNHIVINPGAANQRSVTINPTGMIDGSIISISVSGNSGYFNNCIELMCSSGYTYKDGTHTYPTAIYLYSGESVKILKNGNDLIILSSQSGIYTVGEILYSFKTPLLPAVEAKGQLVNRGDYPRLWNFIKNPALISDATYNTNPSYYSGCFTSGNGLTTFRIPDLRGVFIRGLDNNRGLDLDRTGVTQQGTYLADEFKSHSHKIPNGGGTIGGTVTTFLANNYSVVQTPPLWSTTNEGGTETRPKNVAYTAYIKI